MAARYQLNSEDPLNQLKKTQIKNRSTSNLSETISSLTVDNSGIPRSSAATTNNANLQETLQQQFAEKNFKGPNFNSEQYADIGQFVRSISAKVAPLEISATKLAFHSVDAVSKLVTCTYISTFCIHITTLLMCIYIIKNYSKSH